MVLPARFRQDEPSWPARLGPFLGHVTTTAARVFIRLKPWASGPVLARSRPVGAKDAGPPVVLLPITGRDAFTGEVPLAGGAEVLHEILLTAGDRDAGRLLARAAPSPSHEGRVAFAFGSCWKVDAVGRPEATWEMLADIARARFADHLLLLGDQIYADETPLPSRPGRTAADVALDAATKAERVDAYRQAYARAWEVSALHEALGLLPTVSTWDDHEIANGFGSATAHAEPKWRALFEAAADVHDEHQGWRNPPRLEPTSRCWAFRRGPAAFVGLDLRTHRSHAAGALLGDAQKAAVREWIEREARHARVLFVASSVPPLHLPRIFHAMHGVLDIRDQWERTSEPDRAWLLQRLADFEEGGRRRAVVLGGDAHLATAVSLTDRHGRATWQLTSSPLAQRLPAYVYPALTLLGRSFTARLESGERRGARIERRWRGANVGVVHGDVREDRIDLTFELHRPGRRPVAVRLS